MAHHFDLDQARTLQEPVTFTVNTKKYTVRDLTVELEEELKNINETVDGQNEQLVHQLAAYTGEPAEEFRPLTYQQKAGLAIWIASVLNDPLGRLSGAQRR